MQTDLPANAIVHDLRFDQNLQHCQFFITWLSFKHTCWSIWVKQITNIRCHTMISICLQWPDNFPRYTAFWADTYWNQGQAQASWSNQRSGCLFVRSGNEPGTHVLSVVYLRYWKWKFLHEIYTANAWIVKPCWYVRNWSPHSCWQWNRGWPLKSMAIMIKWKWMSRNHTFILFWVFCLIASISTGLTRSWIWI